MLKGDTVIQEFNNLEETYKYLYDNGFAKTRKSARVSIRRHLNGLSHTVYGYVFK
jgi:hypothetical protein